MLNAMTKALLLHMTNTELRLYVQDNLHTTSGYTQDTMRFATAVLSGRQRQRAVMSCDINGSTYTLTQGDIADFQAAWDACATDEQPAYAAVEIVQDKAFVNGKRVFTQDGWRTLDRMLSEQGFRAAMRDVRQY